MRCPKCGKESYGLLVIIEKDVKDDKGHAVCKEYSCFNCGMEELKRRLEGIPVTIQVPHYPEYINEEIALKGASINYIAELVDFPTHK